MSEPRDWLEYAREDVKMAALALREGIYNQVCFHSQQATEKVLKAFLLAKGRSYPKIHSLGELLELCRDLDEEFIRLREKCAILDVYYSCTRYPDAAEGAPGRGEAREAIAAAKEALEFVEGRL